ncbi:hypothetical protein [Phenylobacterium sp.]|jgi:hypothetical protein|uniref:hypothetical protein n=1 Tax=Phenylobacterium sp. TaxID=1871053 RepID=UPI002F40A981
MVRYAVAVAAAPLFAAAAPAAPPANPAPAAQPPEPGASSGEEVRRKAGGIITQPARDVGLSRKQIPPVLAAAARGPYSLDGLKTCKSLVAAIQNLNQVLGPDYDARSKPTESRAGKLAEAGGAAVVNSLIPFRGVVREVSGAAPADRRLNAAVDAGLARRGFLRGVHRRQGCKPGF